MKFPTTLNEGTKNIADVFEEQLLSFIRLQQKTISEVFESIEKQEAFLYALDTINEKRGEFEDDYLSQFKNIHFIQEWKNSFAKFQVSKNL